MMSLVVVATVVPTGSARSTVTAVTIAEDGTVFPAKLPATGSVTPTKPLSSRASSVGGPTIEDCFVSACQTDAVRNTLIQNCKQMGYQDCDSISYYDTYFVDPQNQPTFGVTTSFSYNTSDVNVEYSRANAYYTEWNNKLSAPQQEELKHQVGKETTQSFTNLRAESFSSSISVSVSAGLPGILQEKISTTFSTSISTSASATQSATTSQMWEVDETINVPAHTCAKACIFETDGALSLPYEYTGVFESAYVDPQYHIKVGLLVRHVLRGAQCCLSSCLRPSLRPSVATTVSPTRSVRFLAARQLPVAGTTSFPPGQPCPRGRWQPPASAPPSNPTATAGLRSRALVCSWVVPASTPPPRPRRVTISANCERATQ